VIPELGAGLCRQALMRRRRGMRDQAFCVAEILEMSISCSEIGEAKGSRLAAFDLEGNDAAASLHLARARVRAGGGPGRNG